MASDETITQPTQTDPSYDSSGGGMDIVSGIIASGVDTGAIISEYLMAKKTTQNIEKARKEDMKRADRNRMDKLRQQDFSNKFAMRGQNFAESQFNFGRMKWGKEFNLTKRQYKDQQKLMQQQLKERGFDRLAGDLTNVMVKDQNVKNTILSRYGV